MNKLVLVVTFYFLAINVIFAEIVNPSELSLINKLKIHEIESHKKFQEELYLSSDQFIKIQSEEFVDNETGFFKLWGEAFSYFDSNTKKEARWKSRLEKYFRTTEYLKFIRNKQEQYSKLINSQRQELLGKLHTNDKQLFIERNDLEATMVSNNEIAKVVDSVNKLVLTEVIPEVLELLLIPLCLSLLGMLLGLALVNTNVGRVFFIVSLVVSVWLSFKYSNDLEQEIIESFEIKEKKHLIILPQLQKNTVDYYKELTNKINKK